MSRLLVGAATWRTGMTRAEMWADLETRVGPLASRRTYTGVGDTPATFADSPAAMDVGYRRSVMSIKPDVSVLASGDVSEIQPMLDTVPRSHEIDLVVWHEPHDNIDDGEFTAADYRAACTVAARLVHSYANARWRLMQVFMNVSFVAFGFKGRDAAALIVPECDVLGVDAYSLHDSSWPPLSGPLSGLVEPARRAAADRGIGLAVTECGTDEHPDNPDYRPQWIYDAAAYCASRSVEQLLWFDLDKPGGMGDWRLVGAAADAYRAINRAGYGR